MVAAGPEVALTSVCWNHDIMMLCCRCPGDRFVSMYPNPPRSVTTISQPTDSVPGISKRTTSPVTMPATGDCLLKFQNYIHGGITCLGHRHSQLLDLRFETWNSVSSY